MEHKRTMTSRSHCRHYESWSGCAGEAAVKVQRGKGTRMSNSPRGGSNREVVRKEISVRIVIACGHDTISPPWFPQSPQVEQGRALVLQPAGGAVVREEKGDSDDEGQW
jgi:hypothetical protein